MSSLGRHVQLAETVGIPQLGLGVFRVEPEAAQQVVEAGLAAGYRHIDTAAAYVNESGVGAALRAAGLPRDEVFVTSKLRNGDQGFEGAVRAYDDSCARLGLDHLDLYLIHWPNPKAGLWQDSWRALQRLHTHGRVRAIGVSNFLPEHLRELDSFADIRPAVNQIEVHPAFQQRAVRAACHDRGIAVEAYSPLGNGAALRQHAIGAIASAHGVSPAQVVLRWHLQHDHIVIPKTVRPDRMLSNADLDSFALDAAQMSTIDGLEAGARTGNDPRTFDLSQIR